MAWVKNYTALLQDPDYLDLTPIQRSVLHGVWLLCGVRGRPVPLVSSFCGRALALRSQDCGPALKVLLSKNFIELCDPTQNVHEKLPHLEESRVDKKREKETPTESPKEDFPPGFMKFWVDHPRDRRGSKAKAWSAWKQALKRASETDILTGHADYCRSDESRDYPKGAAAWLNDDRWTVNYRALHKPTANEQLQDWVNGTQGYDSERDTIDGEYMEVSGNGSTGDSGGLLHGAIGSERQGSGGRSESVAGQLGKSEPSQAGGHSERRNRIQAITQAATRAVTARTKS